MRAFLDDQIVRGNFASGNGTMAESYPELMVPSDETIISTSVINISNNSIRKGISNDPVRCMVSSCKRVLKKHYNKVRIN
jgi:hypothetical protein